MLGPTYLVVSDSGVQGRYNDLEGAKQALNDINSGNRLIAEVTGKGILNRDPHVINGHDQHPNNGFNKWWCGWNCINNLMDVCQDYLDSIGRLHDFIAPITLPIIYNFIVQFSS